MLRPLFDQFLMEKQYAENCSHHTIDSYVNAFKAYARAVGTDELPTQSGVSQFILDMRKRGLTIRTCNNYLTAFGVFIRWMREAGNAVGPITIKHLKDEKKILPGFTDEEIKKIVRYRPTTFHQKRLRAMLLTLIDTGARIDEVLTLERDRIYLDSFSIKLYGKGRKERIVPDEDLLKANATVRCCSRIVTHCTRKSLSYLSQ